MTCLLLWAATDCLPALMLRRVVGTQPEVAMASTISAELSPNLRGISLRMEVMAGVLQGISCQTFSGMAGTGMATTETPQVIMAITRSINVELRMAQRLVDTIGLRQQPLP